MWAFSRIWTLNCINILPYWFIYYNATVAVSSDPLTNAKIYILTRIIGIYVCSWNSNKHKMRAHLVMTKLSFPVKPVETGDREAFHFDIHKCTVHMQAFLGRVTSKQYTKLDVMSKSNSVNLENKMPSIFNVPAV